MRSVARRGGTQGWTAHLGRQSCRTGRQALRGPRGRGPSPVAAMAGRQGARAARIPHQSQVKQRVMEALLASRLSCTASGIQLNHVHASCLAIPMAAVLTVYGRLAEADPALTTVQRETRTLSSTPNIAATTRTDRNKLLLHDGAMETCRTLVAAGPGALLARVGDTITR